MDLDNKFLNAFTSSLHNMTKLSNLDLSYNKFTNEDDTIRNFFEELQTTKNIRKLSMR
jgi:hypothetical protein